MTATIATEIHAHLERTLGHNIPTKTNRWNGLDLQLDSHGRIVRITEDDGQISLYILTSNEILQACADFTAMPAETIATVAATYLA